MSPAKPGRVWALIEAEDGALFRSDDDGATWQRLSEERNLRLRFWYYGHVFADPQDPDTVYVLNIQAWKSVDGGRTFAQMTTPHGDNHDLWIDPRQPQRMIEGNDGGACVSFNGGASWSTIYNQPTAQFYHVATDTRFPYRVYGTQQDNTAICVPSRSEKGAILSSQCYPVGSSESGYIAVRPDNPNIVYSGAIGSAPGGGGVMLRYDHATEQVRIITVWPEIYGGWGAKDLKYRFQWTYPIVLSPHDPNILYAAGNVLFRSTDEGMSWDSDQSRPDPSGCQQTGTLRRPDQQRYDGGRALLHHLRLRRVAAPARGLLGGLGRRSDPSVSERRGDLGQRDATGTARMDAHQYDRGVAPRSGHRLCGGDALQARRCAALSLQNHDYGQTWQRITAGIPAHDFTRVIREDPARRGLLYAGTETGVYVSFDDGASWQSLRLNLPAVPVYDLVIKEHELVAATHGRSFWILDDLTPLHQLTDEVLNAPAHLFAPRPTFRLAPPMGYARQPAPGKSYMVAQGAPATYTETPSPTGQTVRTFLDAGKNPPDGAIVTYYLRQEPEGEVTLSFLDAQGQLIKRFSSVAANNQPTTANAKDPRLPAEAGLNRFVWNLRYPDARGVPGDVTTERSLTGPLAPPGIYQVQLSVGGETYTAAFELRKDPRVSATPADFAAQFSLLLRIRDKLSETHDAINRLRSIRQQVEEWERRAEAVSNGQTAAAAVAQAAAGITEKLTAIEAELIQSRARVQQDQLNFPTRLNAKLSGLTSVVASADGAPTQQAYEVFHELSSAHRPAAHPVTGVIDVDVAAFNELIRDVSYPGDCAESDVVKRSSEVSIIAQGLVPQRVWRSKTRVKASLSDRSPTKSPASI